MKKFFVFVATATLILSGCGASKNAQLALYQQQLELQKMQLEQQQLQQQQLQQQQSQQPQRPTRTKRTAEPCIELANEDSEYLRAYGTSTSYIEKTALNEAERDARNNLAEMIKTAVEGAAQDYERNSAQNDKKEAAAIGEAIMTQYVAEEVTNTRVLRTDIYDLSDGSVQVYVCIEMREKEEVVLDDMKNSLGRDGVIENQYDRDRFAEKMQAGLEEYKKKRNAE